MLGTGMTAQDVVIRAPGAVTIRQCEIPGPSAGEARVLMRMCGISPGTELLAYRGLLPDGGVDDAELDPHAGATGYPMLPGYCTVGVVDSVGDGVDPDWIGRRVFTFHPHGTHAVVVPDRLIGLPDLVSDELATFIPNLETAIGLVMDARPMLGERVIVLGQGIVGLLVTRLLSRFPLEVLATSDHLPERRRRSRLAGADLVIDPNNDEDRAELQRRFGGRAGPHGADLVLELTGNPEALNDAVELVGYGGRIIAGSWYGSKPAQLDLGGRFHRNRITLTSSQVSTIDPERSGRWTKDRRMSVVVGMLTELGLQDLVTHRFPLNSAGEAYELLDMHPNETLQVLLTATDDLDGSE